MQNQTHWSKKVQKMLESCGKEFKRTTAIGRSMISASKANSTRHDHFEKLGKILYDALGSGELKWDHPEVSSLIEKINTINHDLEGFEQEVQHLKTTDHD